VGGARRGAAHTLFLAVSKTEHTRITTPFNRESTADEVLAGVDLTGKRAIVTGGGSGIGAETARALASAGAEVTLAVRNIQAGESAAARCGRVPVTPALSSLPST
jgi:NADPH-dependent 2,4-dienoyl-CoA reductase/sulfur reductase-like enzyme